jgi:hypothetical protein
MDLTLTIVCSPRAFAALLATLHQWQAEDPRIVIGLTVTAPELTPEQLYTLLAASPFTHTSITVVPRKPS